MKRFMYVVPVMILLLNVFRLSAVDENEVKLVDLEKYIPGIKLEILYATPKNFAKEVVYPKAKAYLVEEAASALLKVQSELNTKGLGLKIWDGYRPLEVQKKFWSLVPDERFVADPKKGSRHNRGCAVDCTLIDLKTGKELEMPTEFDDFSEKAYENYMGASVEAIKNRETLNDAMKKVGFKRLETEWWHFDYCGQNPQKEEWKEYPILNKSFDELEKE